MVAWVVKTADTHSYVLSESSMQELRTVSASDFFAKLDAIGNGPSEWIVNAPLLLGLGDLVSKVSTQERASCLALLQFFDALRKEWRQPVKELSA